MVMNKEEQIKRLAQNLFKSGFTKSQDYAIQTAAKMLGFDDKMLQNDLMRKEEARYGAESLLNMGYNYADAPKTQPSRPQVSQPRQNSISAEQVDYSSSDYTKRISQKLAEERVYDIVPGAKDSIKTQYPENKITLDNTVQGNSDKLQSSPKPEGSITLDNTVQTNEFIPKRNVEEQRYAQTNSQDSNDGPMLQQPQSPPQSQSPTQPQVLSQAESYEQVDKPSLTLDYSQSSDESNEVSSSQEMPEQEHMFESSTDSGISDYSSGENLCDKTSPDSQTN